MRPVGPQTQAQLEAGVISRAVRVSVFDELGTEFPINPDLLVGFPQVKGDLDGISWRMDLAVRVDASTKNLLLRGRTIQAWDVFAAGEDLSLFKGKIADPRIPQDYSGGTEKVVAQLVAVGQVSDRLEALLTRFKWAPAPFNPDAASPYAPTPAATQPLTAILKRYRMTFIFPGTATLSTTLTSGLTVTFDSSGVANGTKFTLSSVTGLTSGDVIYLYKSRKAHRLNVSSVNPATKEVVVKEILSSGYVSGDPCAKGGFLGIPITLPYFGSTTLESWVELWKTVTNPDDTAWTQAGNWEVYLEQWTGVPTIRLITSPGEKFSVDMKAVDRWVLLNRRKYHNGTTNGSAVPYFYLLDGIAGQSGSERQNDLAKTTVLAAPAPTNSTIYVADPSGIFATTTGSNGSDRWASVWIGGVEYRGKVASVDKTVGSGTYGRVTFTAGYELRNASGVLAAGMVGGEVAANTGSTHYEILDPSARVVLVDGNGNYAGPMFLGEPQGGWFMLGYKTDTVLSVVPDFDQQLFSLPGMWKYQLFWQGVVIEGAETRASNDVSEGLRQILLASGYSAGEITMAASGYTLAPFARANVKAGDLVDDVRRQTVPPNYRLLEDESGNPVGGYIVQKATPDLTLRGVRNFTPRELPKRITRVIVKGKQIETNRAGQLMHTVEGIRDLNRLFDGYSQDQNYGKTSAITTSDPARAVFKIPKCEPGRYPIVARVVTQSDSQLKPWVGACDKYHRTKLSANVAQFATALPVTDASRFYNGQRIRLISASVAGVFEDVTIQSISGNTITLTAGVLWPYSTGDQVVSSFTYLEQPFNQNDVAQTFTKHEFAEGFEFIMAGQSGPESESYLVVEWNAGDGSTTGLYIDEVELLLKEGAYWETKFVDGGGSTFGSAWTQPDRTLSMSQRTAPTAWLQRNMADYAKGVDRILVIEAEGVTVAQAREIAEAWLNQSVRSSELYDCECDYDPRAQRGDTVLVPLADGTTRTLLLWGIEKGERSMKCALADYSR